MSRRLWPLRQNQPSIQLVLVLPASGQALVRYLLADTAAGSAVAGFELIMLDTDCLHSGGVVVRTIALTGAFVRRLFRVFNAQSRSLPLGLTNTFRRWVSRPCFPAWTVWRDFASSIALPMAISATRGSLGWRSKKL